MLVLLIIAFSGSLLFYLLQPPVPNHEAAYDFQEKAQPEVMTEPPPITNIQL
ncbi:hypothetical protein [Paenibacillus sp. R14(2021)]|uniref:hypothetical protein n=1 Tax=Paenibacillus sp. R14(2021) TaxID=2859228 RepID=UPI001C611AB7|nr:hypothetical protein [Paenibacillus sp. R14(2021)]